MSDTQQLDHESHKNNPEIGSGLDRFFDINNKVIQSNFQRTQYTALRKRIERMDLSFHDRIDRENEDVYTNLFRVFQVYGSGYTDALRKYRIDTPFALGKDRGVHVSQKESQNSLSFSRTSLSFFVVFSVMVLTSICIVARGYFESSYITIEMGVFVFVGGLIAGMTWLSFAKIELSRARNFH